MSDDFYATPIHVQNGETTILQRIPLNASGQYNEDYVRNLAFDHPSCLPINEIDSTFRNPIPIAKELSTPAGFIDAIFITKEGRLVIMEAKLWKNPEARRKVIGQILDYAKELGRWGYENLQHAVGKASKNTNQTLFEIVSQTYPDLDEIAFVDGVSECLRRGRFLLLIAGDGIRSEAAAIAEFIERVGSLEFTFGMVELALYQSEPESGILVQPRVLAKSEIIQRSVITVQGGEAIIEDDVREQAEPKQPSGIGAWNLQFWTELDQKLALDHPDQDKGNPSKKGNYFLAMPPNGSEAWLSAYFLKSEGQAGVSLTFTRGSMADRLYRGLYEQQNEITSEFPMEFEWLEEEDGKYYISTYRTYSDPRAPEHRSEILSFLCEALNTYVNCFRPRMERILENTI